MACYSNTSDGKVYSYVLPGNPVPLARPRFSRGNVWDSQSVVKLHAGQIIKDQHGDLPLLTGALHMDVTFFMPISSCASMKKRQRMRGAPHIYRPDFSNMLKFIEDVCQGIVYGDDCIISSICGSKIYDDTGRTEIILSEILYDK